MSVRCIRPSAGLKGEINIPGDKSISHRSIMLGSIAQGTTEITHFLKGADCLSTIGCFRRMGIEIEEKPDYILVHGKGLRGLTQPPETLNVGTAEQPPGCFPESLQARVSLPPCPEMTP